MSKKIVLSFYVFIANGDLILLLCWIEFLKMENLKFLLDVKRKFIEFPFPHTCINKNWLPKLSQNSQDEFSSNLSKNFDAKNSRNENSD